MGLEDSERKNVPVGGLNQLSESEINSVSLRGSAPGPALTGGVPDRRRCTASPWPVLVYPLFFRVYVTFFQGFSRALLSSRVFRSGSYVYLGAVTDPLPHVPALMLPTNI